MKQNLLFKLMLFMAVMLFGASGAFAADETITFSQQGYDNSEEITTVSGTNFTITFNIGTNNSNAPKYYNAGTAIRVYGGNYFTVSSSTKTIKNIALTFSSGEGSNAITTDVGTYDNGTWTGSAQSVKFTVGGTSGHRRLASVAVTYATGGGGDDDSKIDIATLNGISPTNVEVGDIDEFTLDATFAEGTVAGEDYEVSWTSSNPEILDLAGNLYEAKAAGEVEVTVSVTVQDDTKYNEVTETFSVTVTKPFDATAYELVTDASTLADGDEIIIAYVNADEETTVAMGAQRDNNRGAVGVQVNSDGILVNNEDVQLITLEKDEEGFFYFNVGNGYLYAAGGSSGNYLKTEKTLDEQDRAKATISITEGSAKIEFQTTQTTRRLLKYNNSGTSNLFSCYASGQNEPQIYRKAEPVTVTIGQHGYATYCGDKNLDFAAATDVTGAPATINAFGVTEVNNGYMGMTEFGNGVYVAEQGAILKAEAGEYVVPVAITDGEMAGNLLVGNATQEAITVPGGTNVYRFGYSPAAGKVGFMQSSSDFTVGAGKAYLQVPEQMNAAEFLSFDGEATGISTAEVETTASDAVRYNLNGQRVNSNYRGVVIVDGKKLIQK